MGGGSFEQNLGFGWDFCFTKHPGAAFVGDASEPNASSGTAYLSFDSTRACSDACSSEHESDAQLGFWLDAPLPAGVPLHLYFDAINLAHDVPSGALHFDQVSAACDTTASFARIALDALGLTSEWQTRCVTFVPTTPVHVFGLYVSGEGFSVGLDAFRFGPPCHAP